MSLYDNGKDRDDISQLFFISENSAAEKFKYGMLKLEILWISEKRKCGERRYAQI